MDISLGERTPKTVRIYFEQAQRPCIKSVLPQKAQTVEEALRDYRASLLPGATSYGRTIWADGRYIGDIWCYCINRQEEPNAMLSYCLFDTSLWRRGIATKAVEMFLAQVRERYALQTVGAFTFSDNPASARVLQKNGFSLVEEFSEDGRPSMYFQYAFPSVTIRR